MQTKPNVSCLLKIEQVAFKEFENIGDEGLFPNHSDKDIWVNGFKAGFKLSMFELNEFFYEMGEDWYLWEEQEQGPYPISRVLDAMKKYINKKNN